MINAPNFILNDSISGVILNGKPVIQTGFTTPADAELAYNFSRQVLVQTAINARTVLDGGSDKNRWDFSGGGEPVNRVSVTLKHTADTVTCRINDTPLVQRGFSSKMDAFIAQGLVEKIFACLAATSDLQIERVIE